MVRRLPGRGDLVEIVGGEQDGRLALRLAPQSLEAEVDFADFALHEQDIADARACRLLESLLDNRQFAEWRATRYFWVVTSRGMIRLGRFSDLRHRPADRPWIERSICVVPADYRRLPTPDIWVALLLALRADVDRFLHVAIVGSEDLGAPPRYSANHGSADGSLPLPIELHPTVLAVEMDDADARLARLETNRGRARNANLRIDAAYLDFEVAHTLCQLGRWRDALAASLAAAIALDAHAATLRDRRRRQVWLRAHHHVFELAGQLVSRAGDRDVVARHVEYLIDIESFGFADPSRAVHRARALGTRLLRLAPLTTAARTSELIRQRAVP